MSTTEGQNPVSCPFCQRTLISRLSDKCQYCLKELPEEICLSDEEKEEYRLAQREIREEIRKRYARRTPDDGPFMDGVGFWDGFGDGE